MNVPILIFKLGNVSMMQWGTFATFYDEDGNTFLLKG